MSQSIFTNRALALASIVASVAFISWAQRADADIVQGQSSVDFEFGGQAFSIRRNENGDAKLPRGYAKTSRSCPSQCIEPGQAAVGVTTLTELDVFTFMQNNVSLGMGLLVDARLPDAFKQGSIPGAISVPAATLVANNPYREDLLLALGAKGALGQMDFSGAFDLLIFDDGPWSPTAREAVQLLLEAGYPAQKILYYRGGLQLWHLFGLTVSE